METSHPASHEMITAALDGDRVAQQIILSEYLPLIASVAWKNWPDEFRRLVDREDLVQDVVLRLLQKLHTCDRSRLPEFPGWVRAVAASAVADKAAYWRAFDQGRVAVNERTAAASGLDLIERFRITMSRPEKPARLAEAKAWLTSAIQRLVEDQREAISRKYFAGQSHAEIASAMGRSPGAVRELLRRAEANLEELMGTESHWLSSR